VATEHQATATPTESKPADGQHDWDGEFGSRLATVAAVGIGVALIEAELIPGMLIGIGAMLAPNLLNRVGAGLRPLIKSAVRAGYSIAEQTKETLAEASEQYQDIVAEVRSEHEGAERHAGSPPAAPA
jgi:hypothetical protein